MRERKKERAIKIEVEEGKKEVHTKKREVEKEEKSKISKIKSSVNLL